MASQGLQSDDKQSFNNTMTSRNDMRLACDRRANAHFFIFPMGWYGYAR